MAMSKKAWSKKEVPWQKVAQYYASIVGSYSLFTIGIQPDAANSNVQIISIDQPSDSLIEKRSLGEKENGIRLRKYYDTEYDENDDSDEDDGDGLGYAALIINVASSYASVTGETPANVILDTIRLLQFVGALDEDAKMLLQSLRKPCN
ncbi:uncharacterized protein LOC117183021 [Belonocnema kinseyi]|uniref:uncharacterized protein LOC117183021 n=1 Tax=Belonocnema kinseyi TaxID=2817044 RepID=UPI00143CE0FD|nr:uncharacterized protein LOC117183021 [Belonocnema kinseyi]